MEKSRKKNEEEENWVDSRLSTNHLVGVVVSCDTFL